VIRALSILLVLVLGVAPAFGRAEKVVDWDLKEVFPTAVRFLRVDERVTIVEKDADSGYVLFDVLEEKKKFRGSLELVAFEEEGKPQVRIIITIEDRPEYVELGMVERLERKLHAELGTPRRREPKPEPAPEEGDGKNKDKGKAKGK
jgi:hypothetical protein